MRKEFLQARLFEQTLVIAVVAQNLPPSCNQAIDRFIR
jgi:hypothetical protein